MNVRVRFGPRFQHLNIRLGRWSQILAPGYSYCRRCKTPWLFVEERTVWYTRSSGQFALCIKCWDEATAEQRVAAHMIVSAMNDHSVETYELIREKVYEESTHA